MSSIKHSSILLAVVSGLSLPASADVLFDNGLPNGNGGTSNATSGVFGFRRTLLDDFTIPEGETWRIEAFRHRHVWGTPMGGSQGKGVELAVWRDRGGEPWFHEFDMTLIGYEEVPTGERYFSREEAESFSTFEPIVLGPGHHWIEMAIIGPENNFWLTAEGGGSQSWVNFDDLGGLQSSTNQFGAPRDYSFQLEGALVEPLRFEYPNGPPDLVRPCGDSVRVNITSPEGVALDPESPTLHYDTGAGFATVPLDRVSLVVYDAIFPEFPCGSEVRFYLSARTTSGETFTDPPAAPADLRRASSGTDLVVILEDDMEEDRGWTVENENVTAGGWARGVPSGPGTESRREPPEDSDGSGQAWVTGIPEFEDLDGGPTRLISPVLDAGGAADLLISYSRWNTARSSQKLEVDLSNDAGKTWVTLERVPFRVWWIDRTVPVASILAPTDAMRIRFSANDPESHHIEAGLDAVRVVRVECNAAFPGDIDHDGDVDFQDLVSLLSMWGPCDPPEDCPGDLNGNGSVEFGDVIILISSWQPCGG